MWIEDKEDTFYSSFERNFKALQQKLEERNSIGRRRYQILYWNESLFVESSLVCWKKDEIIMVNVIKTIISIVFRVPFWEAEKGSDRYLLRLAVS